MEIGFSPNARKSGKKHTNTAKHSIHDLFYNIKIKQKFIFTLSVLLFNFRWFGYQVPVKITSMFENTSVYTCEVSNSHKILIYCRVEGLCVCLCCVSSIKKDTKINKYFYLLRHHHLYIRTYMYVYPKESVCVSLC